MKKALLLNFCFVTFSLLLSSVAFSQWNQVNSGISSLTQGVKILGNTNTHIFASANAKLYRSDNYGNQWSEIQPPVALNTTECGYYFNNTYFAGMNSSQEGIFYTSDNGTTWTAGTNCPKTTTVVGFWDLNNILFAFTTNKGIYRSTDGGISWDTANVGLSNLNVAMMSSYNNTLFAATIGGGVFVSTDNGLSWQASNTGIDSFDLNSSLIWQIGNKIAFYGQGGGYYESTDAGANWVVKTKPLVSGPVGGIIETYRKASNLYLKTRHFANFAFKDSVFVTTNEGITWTNITGNLPSNLNGSGLRELGGYVFIGYNLVSPNEGIYRRNALVGINEETSNNQLVVYPNPAYSSISFSGFDFSSVDLITIDGRLLQTHNKTSNTLDVSMLPAGTYFLRFNSDKHQTTKRIIKM